MNNRFYSKKQEKKVANLLDAKVTPNSGATHFDKGDVSGEHLLVECKTVTKPQKSHSIKKDWIEKNEEEAFGRGKRFPVLAFDFGDNQHNYFIVREDDFKELYNAWLELYGEGT